MTFGLFTLETHCNDCIQASVDNHFTNFENKTTHDCHLALRKAK